MLAGRRGELVDLLEEREALRRNPAEMLPPVPRAALPPDQLLRLESIEQPRHARRLLDHPLGDFECRYALVAAAAQDAQHVELLQRDAMRFDYRRGMAADQVGRSHQADDRFMGRRLERAA